MAGMAFLLNKLFGGHRDIEQRRLETKLRAAKLTPAFENNAKMLLFHTQKLDDSRGPSDDAKEILGILNLLLYLNPDSEFNPGSWPEGTKISKELKFVKTAGTELISQVPHRKDLRSPEVFVKAFEEFLNKLD